VQPKPKDFVERSDFRGFLAIARSLLRAQG